MKKKKAIGVAVWLPGKRIPWATTSTIFDIDTINLCRALCLYKGNVSFSLISILLVQLCL